jgi:hypothetical protein
MSLNVASIPGDKYHLDEDHSSMVLFSSDNTFIPYCWEVTKTSPERGNWKRTSACSLWNTVSKQSSAERQGGKMIK